LAHERHADSLLLVDSKRQKPIWAGFFPLEVEVQLPDRHDVSCRQSMQALIKSRVPRSPFRARRLLRWRARACGPKKLRFLLMALFCMRTLVASAQTDSSTGSVRGILRLLGSDGTTYVGGGTVVLTGQLKQQTDRRGFRRLRISSTAGTHPRRAVQAHPAGPTRIASTCRETLPSGSSRMLACIREGEERSPGLRGRRLTRPSNFCT